MEIGETPNFRKGLEDTSVPSGQDLVLDIEVDGKPKSVKWYKAGNPLDAAKNKRIKIEKLDDSHYRLTVKNVTPEDAGEYSVEAENDAGSAKSKANINVEGKSKI